MRSIAYASLVELSQGLAQGLFSSEEITKTYLDRISRLDSKAGAFVEVYEESAMLHARAADLQRRGGLPHSPLHGIPIAIKDLCEISGKVTTGGSAAWRDRRSTCTATVVEKLHSAGMILLGKTHTVEFAFGGRGTNPHMGTPRNPWDWNGRHRVPGGSSSGSCVAIAAGMAPAAIGTDTGGSIRIPASMNGITGLKPTHGRVSLYGVIPLSTTLDSVGPLTRSADDAALVYALLAGQDWRDPATNRQPAGQAGTSRPLHAIRVAAMHPEQYPWLVGEDVRRAIDEAMRVLRALGLTIETVRIPVDFGELARALGLIISVEAYREHGDYIEDPSLPFSEMLRERVLRGKEIRASSYLRALTERQKTIQRFRDWMNGFDLLLTPTVPFGAAPVEEVDESITPMSAFTRPVNYLEGSAISLPCGFSAEGMPVGLQLIGGPWQEPLLTDVGAAFQRETDWHRRIPIGLD